MQWVSLCEPITENVFCKATAWARTGTSLSASAHREVEMLVRGWLAWEMMGFRIHAFRVKDLHAHFLDWLFWSPGHWLPPCWGGLLGSLSLSGMPLAASPLPQQCQAWWLLGTDFPEQFSVPENQKSFSLWEFIGGADAAPRRIDVLCLVDCFNLVNCAPTGKG